MDEMAMQLSSAAKLLMSQRNIDIVCGEPGKTLDAVAIRVEEEEDIYNF
jgi:sulfopyruvate decarboxylase TPP-binding subunit